MVMMMLMQNKIVNSNCWSYIYLLTQQHRCHTGLWVARRIRCPNAVIIPLSQCPRKRLLQVQGFSAYSIAMVMVRQLKDALSVHPVSKLLETARLYGDGFSRRIPAAMNSSSRQLDARGQSGTQYAICMHYAESTLSDSPRQCVKTALIAVFFQPTARHYELSPLHS